MYNYDQAVRGTRQFLAELYDTAFGRFESWSETERIILIMGLVALVGFIVARPPGRKRYGPDGSSGFLIVACMIVVGTFVMGLSFVDTPPA